VFVLRDADLAAAIGSIATVILLALSWVPAGKSPYLRPVVIRFIVFVSLWVGASLLFFAATNALKVNFLSSRVTISNESEISEVLLLIGQRVFATPEDQSNPSVLLEIDVGKAVSTPQVFTEASLVVRNISQNPVIVDAKGLLLHSPTGDLRNTDLTYTLKWQGSVAEEVILQPGESDRLNLVAYGIAEGIAFPLLGPGGSHVCLHFLTPDSSWQNGYFSELCQRKWPWKKLQPHVVQMRIDIYAAPLTALAKTQHFPRLLTIKAGDDILALALTVEDLP